MADDSVDGSPISESGEILVPRNDSREVDPQRARRSTPNTSKDWKPLAVQEISAFLRSIPKAVAVNLISDAFLGYVLYLGGKYPKLSGDTGPFGLLVVLFFIVGCFVYSACIIKRD